MGSSCLAANHSRTSVRYGGSWFLAGGTFKVAITGDGDRSLPVTTDREPKGKDFALDVRLAGHGSVQSSIGFEIAYAVEVTVSDPGECDEQRVRVIK